MKKTGMNVEIFLTKLSQKNKTGIRLPRREADSNEEKESLIQLLSKGLISQPTYAKRVEEIDSVTLDDEMYDEFWKICRGR